MQPTHRVLRATPHQTTLLHRKPLAINRVLNHAKNYQGEEYRLSLGMGKPLGMSAVKIIHQLHLSDQKQRYTNLFKDNNWDIGETSDSVDTHSKCVKAFENHILDHISETD